MHPYQADDDVRNRVTLIEAFTSVAIIYVASLILPSLPFSVPLWVGTPSILGVFGLLVWLFNNHLWKARFVQKLPWFHIPDLNGTWQAKIQSSHQGFETTTEAKAIIKQTASRISICLDTTHSTSYSVHAAITRTDQINSFELTYIYVNKPKVQSASTMSMHEGTVNLQICDDHQALQGDYYSGRGRQNYGAITFEKQLQ